MLTVPLIARDDNNLSKGYGFVSFADFNSSDDAIANMNGQFLANKEITVQYAYKKDGKGERHGDEAERKLAEEAKKHNVQVSSQPLPPGLFTQPAAQPPPSMAVPVARGYPPQGFGGMPQYAPPPQQAYQRSAPPPGPSPLPPAPAGLPARPPPSMVGYGGPAGFVPPGFQPPPGFAPPGAPPMGQAFPPGFAPPPGFGGR